MFQWYQNYVIKNFSRLTLSRFRFDVVFSLLGHIRGSVVQGSGRSTLDRLRFSRSMLGSSRFILLSFGRRISFTSTTRSVPQYPLKIALVKVQFRHIERQFTRFKGKSISYRDISDKLGVQLPSVKEKLHQLQTRRIPDYGVCFAVYLCMGWSGK